MKTKLFSWRVQESQDRSGREARCRQNLAFGGAPLGGERVAGNALAETRTMTPASSDCSQRPGNASGRSQSDWKFVRRLCSSRRPRPTPFMRECRRTGTGPWICRSNAGPFLETCGMLAARIGQRSPCSRMGGTDARVDPAPRRTAFRDSRCLQCDFPSRLKRPHRSFEKGFEL